MFSDNISQCTSVKGRLKENLNFWISIKSNDFVLGVISQGYKLPLKEIPSKVILKNNRSSLDNDSFVQEAIGDLLKSKAIVETDKIPYVVNPLTVAQNTNKKRLVLDLRHVNECLVIDKIKFEDWKVALQYAELDNFMFSFDLKSGYHHVDIHEDYQKYLGFCWNFNGVNRYFYFTVLPFGLATAGHIFTKIMRCLVKHWREAGLRCIVYLDDGLIFSPNEALAKIHSALVKSDLASSGLVDNEDKSTWIPTQCLIWLGVGIDLSEGFLYITNRRIESVYVLIKKALFRSRLTARKLACIVGKIISMSLVFGNITSLMLRYSHMAIINRNSWDFYFQLDDKVLCELRFWLDNLRKLNVRLLSNCVQTQRVVYSDASNSGCGGYVVDVHGSECFRAWRPGEASMSSTYRELMGVFTVMQSVTSMLQGKKIKWYTDNQCVVSIINKGSMKSHLHKVSLEIYQFAIQHNMDLYMEWIPRCQNERADLISRTMDRDDWQVSKALFNFLDFKWGPHTFDRFADCINRKVEKFNSKIWSPFTQGVDAFAFSWVGENNWLVPPVYLVPRCVNYLKLTGASATLVVPYWTSAVYWPLLVDQYANFRKFVTDYKIFDNANGIFIQGSVASIFNSEFSGSVIAFRIN